MSILTVDQLMEALRDDGPAVTNIRDYFGAVDTSKRGSGGGYTGRFFDPPDPDPNPDVVTAADLVAVSMLSVDVPGFVSMQFLHPEATGTAATDSMAQFLAQVGPDVRIGTEPAAQALAGVASATYWQLKDLCRGRRDGWGHGLGGVGIGKLLARKRPRLIPVRDRRIFAALGTRNVWNTYEELFQQGGDDLEQRLVALRRDAGVPAHVSDLRIVDVVLWMGPQFRTGHTP